MTRIGLILSLALAACAVRGSGYVGVQTTPVVYQEPPQEQVENPTSERPGYLWVHGRWDWQNGQWAWLGGHWEKERAGYAWSDGRWERRGNAWHWIEGSWAVNASANVPPGGPPPPVERDHGDHGDRGNHDDHAGWQPNTQGPANGGAPVAGGGMYPTTAPPPVRVENYGAPRSGYVWVAGRWDWRNGNWAWVDGHWEKERANMTWVPGRWELQGNYYVWVDGRWDQRPGPAQQGPVERDHR